MVELYSGFFILTRIHCVVRIEPMIKKLFSAKQSRVLFFVDVACAVICREGKILITLRRRKDHMGGLWEFPGGKRVAAESLEMCLKREAREELHIDVKPVRLLKRIDHVYSDRGVSLYFYECELLRGEPLPLKCAELRWVRPIELKRYAFPPADAAILEGLSRRKWV